MNTEHDSKSINIFSHFALIIISVFLGILVGAVDTLFGRTLLLVGDIRNSSPVIFIPFLAGAGLLIILIYSLNRKAQKGMSLIFAAGHGEEDDIPLLLIPLVMVTTWITHLFGGSAGREGVAVQIGGTLAYYAGKKVPIKNASHILLIAGMAAGFAGLFRTPAAATFFALEVLTAGALELSALLPAAAAAFSAAGTSKLLGLEKFSIRLTDIPALTIRNTVITLIIAAAFGLCGLLFSVLLKWSKNKIAGLIKNQYLRIALSGIILSVLLLVLYRGRYSGLGTNLINESLTGGTVYYWDWIIKLILTVFTLAAGFQGGEVTPLFSIGASLGAALAVISGFPVSLAAALGYIAVFGSATNTLIAPIIIGIEVFGPENAVYYIITCIIAYGINMNRSIYAGQKIRNHSVN